METVEFGVQVLQLIDQTRLAGCDVGSKLNQAIELLLPELVRKTQGESTSSLQPADYKVLIARQVTDLEQTLKELNLQQGDYIFLLRLPTAKTKLRLYAQPARPGADFLIEQSFALIGRQDLDQGIDPEIDLTDLLQGRRSVSRRQAELREKDGKWQILLCKDAKGTMFLGDTRLEPDRPYALENGAAISFGSLDAPDLRLYVQYL
jgi:hypothetical protein